jgi:hypothetical protein
MDTTTLIENNWEFFLSLLPPGWERLAWETKAVRAFRTIPDLPTVMRLLFMHLGLGHSLRETAAEARVAGLAEVSDVALLHRLRSCAELFRRLVLQMVQEQGMLPPSELLNGLVVRAVDATNVKEPGKTGSVWRLHTALRLPELVNDHFELTPGHGNGTGETFTRIPVNAGECIMGDRAYGTTAGIAHVHAAGGFTLVRITAKLPIENEDGSRIILTERLKGLRKAGDIGEWPVFVRHKDLVVAGRLCAIRKDGDEIAKTEKKLRRRQSKTGQRLQPETLELAKYVVILSTVPQQFLTTGQVLSLYRYRWQIELLFKRFKSLAQFGHLPKYEETSSKAWLYGKLLLCLLTEKAMRMAKSFSPWGPVFPKGTLAEQVA